MSKICKSLWHGNYNLANRSKMKSPFYRDFLIPAAGRDCLRIGSGNQFPDANELCGSAVLFFRADRSRAYEAQLKPVLEQPDDDLAEESVLAKVENTLVGLSTPHFGHFSSFPSSPTFCKTSNL
jgi:hypothetical protein